MVNTCAKIVAGDDAPHQGMRYTETDSEIDHSLEVIENHLKGLLRQFERLRRLQKLRQVRTGLSSEEK